MLCSPSRTGKCLPLPSAFGKTLTSGAVFSSFPACFCFQGNKIPQARAEVSHLNVTQANNQSGSALPMARRSQPGRPWWCKGDVGARAACQDAPITAPQYMAGGRDPSPGCGVGNGQLSALPQPGQLGFRVLVGGFWGSADLPPSSKLAKPPPVLAPRQGEGGLSPGRNQPWLCRGCCQRSCPVSPLPARWQRAGAWSRSRAPLLPTGQGLPAAEKGSKTCPEPRTLTAAQAGFGGKRLPVAYSICWGLWCWAGGAWGELGPPDVRAQLG